MNIQQFWPKQAKPDTPETWEELISLRSKTFSGFASIEGQNGVAVSRGVNLSLPEGQNQARQFLYRTFEELVESMLSNTTEHRKEELIDAFNFLITIPLFTGGFGQEKLATFLHTLSKSYLDQTLSLHNLGSLVVTICGSFGDRLRNRSWMNNPQDLMFSGHEELEKALIQGAGLIFNGFESFEEFYLYFVAKDSVLQFRLRSHY